MERINATPHPLTLGSLFSGIGGLEWGLEQTGHYRLLWQVENHPYARQVLAKHWPEVLRYEDATILDWSAVLRADILCGGFPCQPVSLAGSRRGQEDERWLWPDFFRAIRAIRPRYVLVENVPGLLSAGMGDVLGDLASIGYDAEWDSLSAAYIGAPHLRKRVFLVAYPGHVTGLQENPPVDTVRAEGEARHHARRIFRTPFPRFNWAVYPPERLGVDDGFPHRMDRVKVLGNTVVPQIIEEIGRRIWQRVQETDSLTDKS